MYNGAGVSVPDFTFVDAGIDNHFSLEAINEIGSNHLTILINGGLDAIV